MKESDSVAWRIIERDAKRAEAMALRCGKMQGAIININNILMEYGDEVKGDEAREILEAAKHYSSTFIKENNLE